MKKKRKKTKLFFILAFFKLFKSKKKIFKIKKNYNLKNNYVKNLLIEGLPNKKVFPFFLHCLLL